MAGEQDRNPALGLLAHERRDGDGGPVSCGHVVEHAREQLALRSDRVVDRLDGDARLKRDLGDRGGAIAALEEQVRRRIVLQANVSGRGVVDVVGDIKTELADMELEPGYFIEYGGQFQSQQSASRRLAILSAVALIGMFLVLYTLFGNVNFSLQVLVALPTAFLGAVAALLITDQNLTVAAMVGFQ